jgi:hypothetical protein
LEHSRDSSKFLIYHELPFEHGNQRFGVKVFDERFNTVWESEVEMPYEDDLMDIEDIEISNEGSVYILAAIYKDKRKSKRKGKPNYTYQVIKLDKESGALSTFEIQVAEKFLIDMNIALNVDEDLICGGFYSNESSFSIDGSFFLRLNGLTHEIESQNFSPFSFEFITAYMTDKEVKKAHKQKSKGNDLEMFSYDLRNTVLKDDGGAVLIAEQYQEYHGSYTDGNGNMQSYIKYIYGDIIAISMNPDGTIDWTVKVPKLQESRNDGGYYSSFASVVMDDKIFLVFNDNPRNLNIKTGKEIETYLWTKESIVALVTINYAGEVEREALFTSEKKEVKICPKVSEQVSKNELILYGKRKKVYQLAKVTFRQ